MGKMKRTMTMDFDGFVDDDDFFDAYNGASSRYDLSSSDSDEEFEDSRMSFTSMLSFAVRKDPNGGPAAGDNVAPQYTVEAAPERKKSFFVGMKMDSSKKLLKENSSNFGMKLTKKLTMKLPPVLPKAANKAKAPPPPLPPPVQISEKEQVVCPPPQMRLATAVLVRSRSEGFIDTEALEGARLRKKELIGDRSKKKLKRTYSASNADLSDLVAAGKRKNGGSLSSLSNSESDSFLLVKDLENGSQFVVKESDQSGMWNKVRDLGTEKKASEEEFEKTVGFSPVVKELMRRESISHEIGDGFKNFANKSVFSKTPKPAKRKGSSLFKNISTNFMIPTKPPKHGDKDQQPPLQARADPGTASKKKEPSDEKDTASSHWIKVRQSGKTRKDLSGLHMCQEIHAHEGSIWTLKFTPDGRYLASAGEDRTIHIWEVQECEVTSSRMPEEGNSMPLHPSAPASPAPQSAEAPGKKKKSKENSIPDYVHVPDTVFSLSERPACSFTGHTADILDLSWSESQLLISSSMDKTVRLWDMETKSCLKTFPHDDYVTGIHFNPVDDNYFISASLDGKVRIWNIKDLSISTCTDVYEMVTAVCYSPNGQDALIGTNTGNYHLYVSDDGKLEAKSRVEIPNRNSQAKKITGFQFLPGNPSEVLVTCADSRIRICNGEVVVHKFKGFRNTSSQSAASFCKEGKYILSASEDSNVYLWKRETSFLPGPGIGKTRIKTASYEHFFCRDVSVAIPWPCNIKWDPQSASGSSKKPSSDSGIGDGSPAASGRIAESPSGNAQSSSSSLSSWSWWDGVRGHGSAEKVTAWGLVIVTAGVAGEIRVYQNFGLPRKLTHQVTLL